MSNYDQRDTTGAANAARMDNPFHSSGTWDESGLRRIARLPSRPGTLAYALAQVFNELDKLRALSLTKDKP
jgi:hypothetical protein